MATRLPVLLQLALLLISILLVVASCTPYSVPLPDLSGTAPAPEIDLPTPAGGRLRLSDYQDQVVFVNFWGTYCPPCVAEMPALQSTYRDLADQPFTIIGVNVEEDADWVRAWTFENDITFPIVLSDDASINPQFELRVMPTTWFIDGQGILRGEMRGELDERIALSVAEILLAELDVETPP